MSQFCGTKADGRQLEFPAHPFLDIPKALYREKYIVAAAKTITDQRRLRHTFERFVRLL
jgi:hypothetical protein